ERVLQTTCIDRVATVVAGTIRHEGNELGAPRPSARRTVGKAFPQRSVLSERVIRGGAELLHERQVRALAAAADVPGRACRRLLQDRLQRRAMVLDMQPV